MGEIARAFSVVRQATKLEIHNSSLSMGNTSSDVGISQSVRLNTPGNTADYVYGSKCLDETATLIINKKTSLHDIYCITSAKANTINRKYCAGQ